jgi:N-acetylneuraminic acid mutarotase
MNHCLEWDQGRNQLIMFGGYTISSNFNDLWTYSIESAQWQQVTPAGTSLPGGRSYHACAFDTQSSTFHVQGGQQRQSQPQTYQDLWRFDFTASDWALINSGNSNVRKFRHSMQYSKSLNSLLLFGGYDDFSQIPTKTIHQFSFNNQLAGWTLFQDSGSQMPSQRTSFSAGFNPLTGEYIVFGGSSGFEFLSTSILQKQF